MNVNAISWALYVLFVAAALFFSADERVLAFDGPLGAVKALVWATWLGFLAFSIHCSRRESLFRTVPKLAEYHWGRQIMLDLYLGLGLALLVVYLNEGGVAVLLWLVPTLLFANLAVLLYFAIHFEALVAKLLA